MSILSKNKLIYGAGINDSFDIVFNGNKETDKKYVKWHSMLKRCYSDKFHAEHPAYIGCTVHKDWLSFSLFESWMNDQDWEGKELDKDILVYGNRLYSPDTCIFVSKKLNLLLGNHKKRRGEYPQGVSFQKDRNKFIAQISINKKQKSLGRFDTPEKAASAYNIAKSNHIREIIATDEEVIMNDKLKIALLRHADRFFALHLEYKRF